MQRICQHSLVATGTHACCGQRCGAAAPVQRRRQKASYHTILRTELREYRPHAQTTASTRTRARSPASRAPTLFGKMTLTQRPTANVPTKRDTAFGMMLVGFQCGHTSVAQGNVT